MIMKKMKKINIKIMNKMKEKIMKEKIMKEKIMKEKIMNEKIMIMNNE
jgi:hypothetical protein